jgi:hypothetical protein
MRNVNQEQRVMGRSSGTREPLSSLGNSGRKAPGMRLGTVEDWRQASGKAEKIPGRHGHAVRDGR